MGIGYTNYTLITAEKSAYQNATTMHGPVFIHDSLHLIIIALGVHFVVNVNANQGISTLLNLLMAHSGQTMVCQ